MEKNRVQFITKTALIAAAYAAITIAFSFLSYGQVQFRISEILVLFAFIDPKYTTGLILGCILANLPSPLGVIDVVVGPIATLIAILFIIGVKKAFGYNKKSLIIASLGPVISNAVIVGLELTYLFQTPFWMNALYVGLGEFVVVTIVGTIVVSGIMKNDRVLEKLSI
nr:QueT transporter family protein [Sedimentibacter sp.]